MVHPLLRVVGHFIHIVGVPDLDARLPFPVRRRKHLHRT